jgi:hypothetical protein
MAQDVILSWAAAIIAVGGAVGVLWKIISPVVAKTKHLMESLDRFTRDWFGEPGDEVHPKRPGMLERMAVVEKELQHNGGSSIKDAVRRIEKKLASIDERLDEGALKFREIEKRIEE